MTSQREVSGWAVGWTMFAAIYLMIAGFFQAFAGLVAIIDDDFYAATPDYVVQFDATTWGWIHLIAGIIAFFAGLYLFSGAVWARIVGVLVAIGSMVTAFAWLPYSPVWSIIIITVDALVIWALTVHGRDIVEASEAGM